MNDPSVGFIFFSVVVVIVIVPVVDNEIGTNDELNVEREFDPIVVFVILIVPEFTSIRLNPMDDDVGVNNDDWNIKIPVVDKISGLTFVPIVVPNCRLIKFNSKFPSFFIPSPLLPNPFPTTTPTTDDDDAFIVTLLIITLRPNVDVNDVISIILPLVPFK
jgi:hypothetical protein